MSPALLLPSHHVYMCVECDFCNYFFGFNIVKYGALCFFSADQQYVVISHTIVLVHICWCELYFKFLAWIEIIKLISILLISDKYAIRNSLQYMYALAHIAFSLLCTFFSCGASSLTHSSLFTFTCVRSYQRR